MKNTSSWEPRSWIVPPGLIETITRFEIRCDAIIDKKKAGKHSCLLIRGETGVGKSMFAECFVHKYLKQYPERKVITINCSAIPETLLESELFGYKKGSSSTADKDKKGILEIAGDGVIILEELGEMEKNLQAKLLVAIERRVFFALGDTKETRLNAQIIATSNASRDDFRPDFWFRFETFVVPPLHKRRYDVIYYVQHFDKELLELLTGGVVLALFGYNWPGNVREVEIVCNAIRENIEYARRNKFIKDDKFEFTVKAFHRQQYSALFRQRSEEGSFRFDKGSELAFRLKQNGVDVKCIETVLDEFRLGLDSFSSVIVGSVEKDLNNTVEYVVSSIGERLKLVDNNVFQKLYGGFLLFCFAFSQDINSSSDLLDLKSSVVCKNFGEERISERLEQMVLSNDAAESASKHAPGKFNYINFVNFIYDDEPRALEVFSILADEMRQAVLECTKFLTGIKDIKTDDLLDIYALRNRYKENVFLAHYLGEEVKADGEEIHIENISLDELRDLYYETLCSVLGTSHGYQKKIAKIAGRTEGRVSQVLDKNGLSDKFKKLNYMPRKRLAILK